MTSQLRSQLSLRPQCGNVSVTRWRECFSSPVPKLRSVAAPRVGWERVAELCAACSGYGGPGAGSQPAPWIGGFGGRYHIILVGGDIVSGTWLFFGGRNSLFPFHLWKSCLCFIFSTPQSSFHIRNTLLLLQISLWS